MLRTCRLLLAKGAFYSIRKSEISFVLRIIKRNYKLKFSGITTSQGLEIRTPQRGLGPLFSLVVCCSCVIMFLLGESSRSERTFLVVVVLRGPGNQDPREIRTSLQPGDLMACCGCPQGAWELGSQREDQDLSVAWGLDGLLWLSPGSLGIRTPERGFVQRCSCVLRCSLVLSPINQQNAFFVSSNQSAL